MHKLAIALVCLFVGGCANTQLNKNTGDLATSLSSIEKRQIVSNLARALNEDEYIPSQVILTLGSATTSNSISPTLGLPFGYGFTSTTALTTGSSAGTSVGGGTSVAAPTLTLALTDSWNQNWTMTPPSDPGQLGRLRELYLYATGYAKEGPPADTKTRFLCNYPVQALAVNLNYSTPDLHMLVAAAVAGGSPSAPAPAPVNVVYEVTCPDTVAGTITRTIYADPTFLTGPDCIICLNIGKAGLADKWGAKSVTPDDLTINPRLKFGLALSQGDPKLSSILVGSQDGQTVYVLKTDAPRFGDLAMFTHQALSQSASTASAVSGKTQQSGATLLYTVR